MSLKVHRILHAGYVLTCNETRIVFDPIFETPFSTNCVAFPAVEFKISEVRDLKLDAVFISHYHDDHCSLKSLNLLDRKIPIFLYAKNQELFSMIRDLGFKVESLELERVYKVGEFEVSAKEALDVDVDSFFEIRVAGLRIINVVDALIADEKVEELAKDPVDLLLWPFQCLQESAVISPRFASWLTPETPIELLSQVKSLKPRLLVPSSCQFRHEDGSWYNMSLFPISYKSFADEVSSTLPSTQVLRLDPGQGIGLSRTSTSEVEALPFVKILDKKPVDYSYNPSLPPPTTAQIAKMFPAISLSDESEIRELCLSLLPSILADLGPSPEAYFQKRRLWQLRVFRNDGTYFKYSYRIQDEAIRVQEDSADAVEWLTEIPAFKLLSAFKNGEALTSLYIRVNDEVLAPRLEQELAWADPLSDPLIRALSARDQISYQRAEYLKLSR